MSNYKLNKCFNCNKKILLQFFFLSFFLCSKSQDINNKNIVYTLKGNVKDSINNYMLIGATISAYIVEENKLISFTLSDKFGSYSLEKLPKDKTIKIIYSYVGYEQCVKYLIKNNYSNIYGINDTIFLSPLSQSKATNEEIIVKAIIPLRMKGDTLEFNADAFKLDSASTAESLLRKLPGFTVWSDGEITYNGKRINSIFVNGKQFLSNNNSITIQNLPKNIIDKVQIYSQKNESNPFDSIMYANLKLKKGFNEGLFGRISSSQGLRNMYSNDLFFSKYQNKIQMSIVASRNNENKISNNSDDMIKSFSFKPSFLNFSNLPDFNLKGLNSSLMAGINVYKDFLPDVFLLKKHKLTIDYFMQNNNQNLNSVSVVKIPLLENDLQSQLTNSRNNIKSFKKNISSNYIRSFTDKIFSFNINASLSNLNENENNITNIESLTKGLMGKSNTTMTYNSSNKNIEFKIIYELLKEGDLKRRFPRNFQFEYTNILVNNSVKSKKEFENINYINQTTTIFNRSYDSKKTGNSNILNLDYSGIKNILFGNHLDIGGIIIKLSNNFKFNTFSYLDYVFDYDTIQKIFNKNIYLTNKFQENVFNYLPSVKLSKSFNNSLTNRFSKIYSLNIHIKKDYYIQKYSSTNPYQNIQKSYSNFLSDIYFDYKNHQFGINETTVNISFKKDLNYPNIYSLAPVVDSVRFWIINLGNINLTPEKINNFNANFKYITKKKKNPFNFDFNLLFSKINNAFSDSIINLIDGRRLFYPINVNKNEFFRFKLDLKKSFVKHKNTFQLNLLSSFYKSKRPVYINSKLFNTISYNYEIAPFINFNYNDKIFIYIKRGISYFEYFQNENIQNKLRSTNTFTQFASNIFLTKNIYLNNNITKNKNSINSTKVFNNVIWNSSFTYRFTKKENLEMKISANDILRQNRYILNNIESNVQTFNSTNVLGQYFIFSLSYYPRKFGNN